MQHKSHVTKSLKKRKRDSLLSNTGESLRIYTVGQYLKKHFNKKMVKLALDGGFTCPNRDGSKGRGGCLFCGSGGGGDFASTIEEQIKLFAGKWQDAGYLAYFQNHTNTYAPIPVLRKKFYTALSSPCIEGIVIATRPDCLSEEVLDLLSEINENHFMWLELGLQTSDDKTADLINRCYPTSLFYEAAEKLKSRNIKTVVHLILGLPGETEDTMFESVNAVIKSEAWGIKLHLLNVVKGSNMAIKYPDYIPFRSIEDYTELVCDIIEILPPEMVVHRMTGDAPRKILIAPDWSYRKRTILNKINATLKKRGTYQGVRF